MVQIKHRHNTSLEPFCFITSGRVLVVAMTNGYMSYPLPFNAPFSAFNGADDCTGKTHMMDERAQGFKAHPPSHFGILVGLGDNSFLSETMPQSIIDASA